MHFSTCGIRAPRRVRWLLLALAPFCAAAGAQSPPPPAPGNAAAAPRAGSPVEGLALPAGAIQTLEQLPAFEPGLWEFRRTIQIGPHATDQPDVVSRCTDPRNDIRKKMTEMMGKGCRITGMWHSGDRFRAKWSCGVEDGVVSIVNVMTVAGTTGYEDVNETSYQQKSTRTKVTAKRVGDCPATTTKP